MRAKLNEQSGPGGVSANQAELYTVNATMNIKYVAKTYTADCLYVAQTMNILGRLFERHSNNLISDADDVSVTHQHNYLLEITRMSLECHSNVTQMNIFEPHSHK